jgi:hypothetical protein
MSAARCWNCLGPERDGPDGLCAKCRDSDGTATAAINEDLSVPKDCQARAESIAQTKSVNP